MRQATITGNLGKEAEWKPGSQGEFLTFSVATSNGKDKQGTYRPSTWVNCTMQDSEYTRKLQQYLTKGTKVLVQGDISCRAWIDKSGNAESSLQISVRNLEFIGGKQDDDSGNTPANSEHSQADSQAAFNAPGASLKSDDIPF